MNSSARIIDPLPLYADWQRAARRRLPRLIFDFIDGAAGEEAALRRNEAAFRELPLMPRVLVDPPQADLSIEFLGRSLGLPFGCAPMGMCDLAGPGTDTALARAAARWRFPLCISTASSTPLERLAKLSEGHAWFQLYVTGSIEAALSLVDRAEGAGIDTLVLTVDVPRLGKRPRDLRNGFRTPLRWQARHLLDFALHPRWSLGTLRAGVPRMANYSGASAGGYDRSAARRGADWEFLQRLRQRWRRTLVVKGFSVRMTRGASGSWARTRSTFPTTGGANWTPRQPRCRPCARSALLWAPTMRWYSTAACGRVRTSSRPGPAAPIW